MTVEASECKCIVCGKQAVAFWPVCDPDIEEHPYCRKCLDEAKYKLTLALVNIDKEYGHRGTHCCDGRCLKKGGLKRET
jgi:hypothetical protein